jgi:hypothetical protein
MADHCAQRVRDRHEQVNDNRAAVASPHGRKLAARWDDMSGRPLGRGRRRHSVEGHKDSPGRICGAVRSLSVAL